MTACGKPIVIADWNIGVACERPGGHPGPCSGSLYTPSGKYVGELTEDESTRATAVITFSGGGRSMDWQR